MENILVVQAGSLFIGVEANDIFLHSALDNFLQSHKGPAGNEENVAGIKLQELLVTPGMQESSKTK